MTRAALLIVPMLAGGLLTGEGADPNDRAGDAPRPAQEVTSMRLTSPAFATGESIPARYTCDGGDVSPPLRWSEVPPGARGLALVVDDPDASDPTAPTRTWVHWVLYDLDPGASGLPEGASAEAAPGGARQGKNDWHRLGYGGPCPPIGRHRYFFRLYALDVVLGDLGAPDRGALERAMGGHVLARAELIGTYERRAEASPPE
ncbi:MAG: YbhB/YbcL family Raf kinase inhibitor-like protein [Nannocystaceae bacterium]